MAVARCLLLCLIVLAIGDAELVSQPTTASASMVTASTTSTAPSATPGLLQVESQQLGELSKQVAETNRALEDLLASKLRDIHYATVIGELRSEIDALR